MDDYRNSPTKFRADLFPSHRRPSAIKFTIRMLERELIKRPFSFQGLLSKWNELYVTNGREIAKNLISN